MGAVRARAALLPQVPAHGYDSSSTGCARADGCTDTRLWDPTLLPILTIALWTSAHFLHAATG
jgi:hypothetical protein